MNAYQQPMPGPANFAAPHREPGTNGLAIATLVTGILGVCIVPWVLGFIALNQIKKSGQKGRGMAVWGMVIATLWLVIGVIVGVVSATTSNSTDHTTTDGLASIAVVVIR
ncbi:DUF4190 domain-containing protein [Nocardia terpenica]|uniref:DUF4190 domain-containing protein n=1 Tax=Nocardia terpenica TaxID=455432 RepID=A0A291REB9_9NOCA|nr:DUF4190 domain-containing protein [Nocardia terpenica]ATL65687.1 hypothetical protein CRH09_05150 [Nocardia terpenica]